jgi:hypothetical protein
MDSGGIDSWIQLLEWIAYNFCYCAFTLIQNILPLTLVEKRILVRNQDLNDSGRCKIGSCSHRSCPGQRVLWLMSRNEWIRAHGVIRLFLHTVLVFDNCIYSLFCCNFMLCDQQCHCESICRSRMFELSKCSMQLFSNCADIIKLAPFSAILSAWVLGEKERSYTALDLGNMEVVEQKSYCV